MKKFVVMLMLAVVSMCVTAGETGLHLASWHSVPGFNNFNPGIYHKFDNHAILGAYYNSERRVTAYSGYSVDIGRFCLVAGVATGYSYATVTPMIVPSYHITKHWNVSVLPNIKRMTGATVVHLSYTL